MNLKKRYFLLAILISTILLLSACGESDAANEVLDWPEQDIQIIVPFDPGGSADRSARGFANYLQDELGVAVTVENYEGSGALVGHTRFYNDENADNGHTFLMTTEPYLSNNIVTGGADFTINDFAFINAHWTDFVTLFAPKDSPHNSLEDIIEAVKENPGELTAGIIHGSAGHLYNFALFEELGILEDINVVNYDGGNTIRTALLGGHVDFAFEQLEGSVPILDEIKTLAIADDERSDIIPDVPTVEEALENYDTNTPLVRGSVRFLTAKSTFKENHPEAFDKFVDTYKTVLDNEEFRDWLEENEIVGDWNGPEGTTEMINDFHDIVVETGDIIE